MWRSAGPPTYARQTEFDVEFIGRGRGRIDVQLNWWNGTTEKDQHPTKLDLGFDPSADFHRYVRRGKHTHPFSSKECQKYALGGRTRANNGAPRGIHA